MSEWIETSQTSPPEVDRRARARYAVRSLAYVDLGEDNGGIVLNISEAGLAVQAVMTLTDETLPRICLQLSPSSKIEASARITWLSESKKEAGVEFVDLSEEARRQIEGWIQSESSPGHASTAPLPSPVPISAPPEEPKPPEITTKPERVHTAPAEETAAPQNEEIEKETFAAAPAFEFGRFTRARFPSFADATSQRPAARQSAFALREPEARESVVVRDKRDWIIVVLALFLAVVSFFAGMLAGRSNLQGILDIFRSSNSSDKAAAQTSESAASSEVPQGAVSNPEPAATSPVNVPVPAPSVKMQPEQPASRRPPPSETTADASSTLVSLPETPVAASSSVAVRTRLSVPLPADERGFTGSQNLQIGKLISKAAMAYPQAALDQKIEGTVVLHAVIAEDGSISSVAAISGPPQLAEPAIAAVRSWRYSPTRLDGRRIETQEDVILDFRLPR